MELDINQFDGYQIIRPQIAHGGAGAVHEALSPNGKRVAIKVLDRKAIELDSSQKFGGTSVSEATLTRRTKKAYERHVERFKDEYQTLVGLPHPHVAQVYKIGFYKDQFYIVSEFIEGKPIAEHVRGMKPVDMIPLFVQALDGLDFIHRSGLIHLDIKSQNVLVQMVKGKPIVKIIDFGLATTPKKYSGAFMGSVSYMAPEVAFGLKEFVDVRADLYSFGVLMYQCIAWGDMPFARPRGNKDLARHIIDHEDIPDPPSLAHHSRPNFVPKFLDTIVMRLISKRPKDRFYSNARALINALATHTPDAFKDVAETRGAYLIPENDRHIGQDKERAEIAAAIETISHGRQPKIQIYSICGTFGMGKSHFLKKIKEAAEKYAESLNINYLAFPSDESLSETWLADLTTKITENEKSSVILVDDLDEAPAKITSTLNGLINFISDRSKNPSLHSLNQPLLIIYTTSKTKPGKVTKARTIKLDPFDANEIKAYLKATPAFKKKIVPDKWIQKLIKQTAGIPAELAEQLHELDSKGLLFGLDGEIAVASAETALSRKEKLPTSTKNRLLKQYQAMAKEEREIVDYLAVWEAKHIAPHANFGALSILMQSSFLTNHLNNLAQQGILKLSDDYRFANNYFASSIYEHLAPEKRAVLHDAVAACIKDTNPKEKEAVFFHQGFGTNASGAVPGLIKLSKINLYERGRAGLSAELLEQAFSWAPAGNKKLRAYLMGLIAESYFYGGKFKKAGAWLKRAASLLNKDKRKNKLLLASIYTRQFILFFKKRKYKQAEAALSAGFKNVRKNTSVYLVLLNFKALSFYQRSIEDPKKSQYLLNQAYETYSAGLKLEANLKPANARRVNNNQIGVVLRAQGKLKEAVDALKNNLENKNHIIFSKMANMIALAESYRMLGDFENALKYGKDVVSISKKTGQGEWLMYAHGVLANICHDMDRFDEAIKENNHYLAASSCLEDEEHHAATSIRLWVHMGHCYKEKKEWNNAIVHFEAAISGGAKAYYLMSAEQGLGEVWFNRKKNTKALKHFARAEKLLTKLPADAVANSHKLCILKIKAQIKSRTAVQ